MDEPKSKNTTVLRGNALISINLIGKSYQLETQLWYDSVTVSPRARAETHAGAVAQPSSRR
jgi:hypothetical protein